MVVKRKSKQPLCYAQIYVRNKKRDSITNHDLRDRLFKKKCCYCGLPLGENETTYVVNGRHRKDGKKMCCSMCYNLRFHLWV